MHPKAIYLILITLLTVLSQVEGRAQTSWDYSLTPLTGSVGPWSASYTGNYSPALDAAVRPLGMDIDQAGNIYLAEDISMPAGGTVRKITPEGTLLPMTGIDYDSGGDGGPSTLGTSTNIGDVAAGPAGSLYLLEAETVWETSVYPPRPHDVYSVRVISSEEIISTLAGMEGVGTDIGLDVDALGNVFAATNYEVWKVAPDGTTEIIAGAGPGGCDGSGGPATLAEVNANAVAVDHSGNIYIAEGACRSVRVIRPDGTIEDFFTWEPPPLPGDPRPSPLTWSPTPRGTST